MCCSSSVGNGELSGLEEYHHFTLDHCRDAFAASEIAGERDRRFRALKGAFRSGGLPYVRSKSPVNGSRTLQLRQAKPNHPLVTPTRRVVARNSRCFVLFSARCILADTPQLLQLERLPLDGVARTYRHVYKEPKSGRRANNRMARSSSAALVNAPVEVSGQVP
jgi:hypothetical protein